MNYKEIIESWGLIYKTNTSGDEIILRDCPFCGPERSSEHPYHLYVNKHTGVFNCFYCNTSGTFAKLARALHREIRPHIPSHLQIGMKEINEWHYNLINNKKALEYLIFQRKLEPRVIKRMLLGLRILNNSEILVIPYIINGELVGVKYRHIDKKQYFAEEGSNLKEVLYNQDVLFKEGVEKVYVVEGEIDALTLMSHGIENVVSLSTGVAQAGSEAVTKLLMCVPEVIVCFDNDVAGRQATERLIKNMDFLPKYIELPYGIKDINDFFKSGKTIHDFQNLPVKDLEIQAVTSLAGLAERMKYFISGIQEEMVGGIPTPFPTLNTHFSKHPLSGGDLVILSGFPKKGKTSLLSFWAIELARKHNIPVLFYSLEMTPEKIFEKFYSVIFNTTEITEENLNILVAEDLPLYITSYFSPQRSEIIDKIITTIKKYNIRVVMFDNLHFLVESTGTVVHELSQTTRDFKLLSEEYRLLSILVAHVTKKADETTPPTAADLRDSAMIRANADHIFILHHPRSAQSPELPFIDQKLILDTSRYLPPFELKIRFYPMTNQFVEITDKGNLIPTVEDTDIKEILQ